MYDIQPVLSHASQSSGSSRPAQIFAIVHLPAGVYLADDSPSSLVTISRRGRDRLPFCIVADTEQRSEVLVVEKWE